MIILYYTKSSGSCRKAIQWFKEHEIEVVERNINYISRGDLFHVLSLSDSGFMDVLKCYSRSEYEIQNLIDKILLMSFERGITFVLKYPEVLKAPIIFDENKLVIGYNMEDIRTFVSREHRRYKSHNEHLPPLKKD